MHFTIALLDDTIVDKLYHTKKAIGYFTDTLQIRTENKFPFEWASTMCSLGDVYLGHKYEKSREQDLDMAIKCYNEAKRIYTENQFTYAWAKMQIQLAFSYKELFEITQNEEYSTLSNKYANDGLSGLKKCGYGSSVDMLAEKLAIKK
jgi:hypothetical protein